MNDQDYIRKAIELADTFMFAEESAPWSEAYMQITHSDGDSSSLGFQFNYVPQNVLDALAAQLVRQVESPHYVAMTLHHSAVMKIVPLKQDHEISFVENEFEWDMNTIKAIVDSDVLTKS